MDFTAIALESGFSESIRARSFIEGGKGDAEMAVLDGLGPGLAEYRESLELVQWMHDYNVAAAAGNLLALQASRTRYSRITPSTAADAYVFMSTLTPATPHLSRSTATEIAEALLDSMRGPRRASCDGAERSACRRWPPSAH